MGEILKKIKVLVESNAGKVGQEMQTAAKGAGGLGKSFQELTGVSFGTVAILGALWTGLNQCIEAAKEEEIIMAATAATIKATGGAAGFTAEQIGDLALSESRLTGIDDEVIQSGQNMLLTFRNIGKDVFPRATRAMEDMSLAFAKGNMANVDLQSSAIQLGKALNDPIQGVTALQRVGVSFTETQKAQIKKFVEMNDIASAQAIILKELESEFGGLGEAMGETATGKMQRMRNEIENLEANIGSVLIPILGEAAGSVNKLFSWTDDMNKVFAEHEAIVRKSGVSYSEYLAEMERAGQYMFGYDWQLTIVNQHQYDLDNGLIKTTDSGYLWIDALNTMTANSQLATSGVKQLDAALASEEDQMKMVTASFNELTPVMLYNKAVQGLTADQALELGRSMGLVNQKTYDAFMKVDTLNQKFKETGDIEEYTRQIHNLAQQAGVLGKMQVSGQPMFQVATPTANNNKVIPGYANGGSFTVPQGYQNDSYVVGLTSGERVSVTPAGGNDNSASAVYIGPTAIEIGKAVATSLMQMGMAN